jgi:hypothetical protein
MQMSNLGYELTFENWLKPRSYVQRIRTRTGELGRPDDLGTGNYGRCVYTQNMESGEDGRSVEKLCL